MVQGEGAKESIVKGLKFFDGKVDTVITGRGGGSIEDLWAFNEEIVARTIAEMKTPVISDKLLEQFKSLYKEYTGDELDASNIKYVMWTQWY